MGLFRYRDVSAQSNARHLNPLAEGDDPTPGLRGLDAFTTRTRPAARRTFTAFHPVARPEPQLFVALMSGERALHGVANSDLGARLARRGRRRTEEESMLHVVDARALGSDRPAGAGDQCGGGSGGGNAP